MQFYRLEACATRPAATGGLRLTHKRPTMRLCHCGL